MKTVGWVCLGLSPNGGVGGSDLIYGWVNSVGQATIVVSLSLAGHLVDWEMFNFAVITGLPFH